ncbi:MAG: hypothetical protein SCK57_08785, partial [Bacillota bacterium]|nr:hypothetical protein [Bacillota bacterium]
MKLNRLSVRYFKGIEELTLTLGGDDAAILGENATCKTTVNDAFTWLLFGKDSQNQSDFEIKPLNPDGSPRHHLEHTVEAELALEHGRRLTLKKIHKEKWTRKRGSASQEHTGHTVDHFVDGVPVKAGEYQRRINELIEEELFRLLTSPAYFSTQLHWQKRRELLMDVCGSITDAEVIRQNDHLASLAAILEQRSIEDHRKVLSAQRKEINRELERIPIRMDEVRRTMTTENQDPTALEEQRRQLEAQAKEQREQLAAMEPGDDTETRRRIRELEEQARQLKHEAQQVTLEKLQRLKTIELEQRTSLMEAESTGMEQQRQQTAKQAAAVDLEQQLSTLRENYKTTAAEKPPEDTCCPTCGQGMPAEQRQAAMEAYRMQRAEKLKTIQREGQEKKLALESCTRERDALAIEAVQWQQAATERQGSLEQLRKEIAALQASLATDETPEVAQLMAEAAALATSQEARQNEHRRLTAGKREALAATEQAIREVAAALQAIENQKAAQARIDELEGEESRLADAFEALEKELYLTETFVREKVKYLESRINSQFQTVRFKLFDEQQNGGLAETCEVTV